MSDPYEMGKQRREWLKERPTDGCTSYELEWLLRAADERDRLREKYESPQPYTAKAAADAAHREMLTLFRGEQTFTIDDCTFEYRPLTDEERDEIASLNAEGIAKCSRENR